MPFTIAHPAIILPLRKRGSILSTTGLIIGSMIPDLDLFIQMREVENLGHQWYGIFLFDMPEIVDGISTLDLSLSIVIIGSLILISSPFFTKSSMTSTLSKSPKSGTNNFSFIL